MKAKRNPTASWYRTEITPVLPIAGYIPCDIWRDIGIARILNVFVLITEFLAKS
jgi:hypothetical protein